MEGLLNKKFSFSVKGIHGQEVIRIKTCSICKEIKSLDEYYSYEKESKTKGKYTYYHPYCKQCSIQKSRNKQLENHDEAKEYWRNISKHKYDNNPAERKRRKDNQKKRENKYFLQKQWQKDNPEKIRQYGIERAIHKKHNISDEEWVMCKLYFNNGCAYCGMPEEKHKEIHKQQLHRDHVNPSGSNFIDNCIPACKSCNSSKHNAEINDWYNELNPNYTIERYSKINKWLQEDYLVNKVTI